MTAAIRVAPEAEAELAAAALWYETKREGLGAEFVAAIDAALEEIADAPLAAAIWLEGLPFRKHVVSRFPFLVLYVVATEGVDVYAFAHARRRPGYWRER